MISSYVNHDLIQYILAYVENVFLFSSTKKKEN